MLRELAAAGQTRLQPGPLPTRVLFRMLGEAAMAIGESPDPDAARAETGMVVKQLPHPVHGAGTDAVA